MSRSVITEELGREISNLRSQNISAAKIAKHLDLSSSTVQSYCSSESNKKERKEAKPFLDSYNNYRSSCGFTWEKIEPIISNLIRKINSFNSLLIIGFQNCEDIVEAMKQYHKKVIADDVRPKVFRKYKEVEKILQDAVGQKFRNTLDKIKLNNSRCAAYINLTGDEDLITYIFNKHFYPIIAVVSQRPGMNHNISSLERCRQLNFKTYHISRGTWLAILT